MFIVNLIFYIISAILIVYTINGCIKFKKFRDVVNKIPGPEFNLIFGNVFQFSRQRDILFKQFRGLAAKYKYCYKFWGGFYYGTIALFKAADFEIILSNPKYIHKYYVYILLFAWLGQGLLTSTEEKWHKRRKILTPAFHFNVLRKFVKIFGEHANNFVEELKLECNKDKTNITSMSSKLTLELICETAMGVKLEENNNKQEEYRKAIHELAALTIERAINPFYYYDIIYQFLPHGMKFFKNVKILHKFTDEVIKERERNFKNEDVENLDKDYEDYGGFTKKRFAMLDLLISAKRNSGEIDDAGIREEVDTFMFEGHDTTAAAITYSIFCLANNKEVQNKARKEMDAIFGESMRSATYNDLQEMLYLEMVIKETLRLYPSVPIISRTLLEDVPINGGKYIMPRGSISIFHIYDLHHDADVFKNPDKFDPDRFLPENCKKRHSYAYVPFSAGPRNCIGQKFAMLEIKSVISAIIRNFEIEPIDTPESVEIMVDLVLRTKKCIHVKFKPKAI